MNAKGTILALVALTVLGMLSGCGGGEAGPLYVVAGVEKDDSGSTTAVVTVLEGGLSGDFVDDATVTINGTELTYFLLFYVSFADLGINAGDDVLLEVQRGGTSVSATLTMPAKPTISAPAGGADSEPVDVSWTWAPATDPDGFEIAVDEAYTVDPDGYSGNTLGTARIHQIPIGTFDTGVSTAYVEVSAVEQTTTLIGDAAASSMFMVGHSDESAGFDPEP